MTAACRRVIGKPVCRAFRSKRRLISRETSCTRNPKFRPIPSASGCSIKASTFSSGPTLFGAMTTLRQGGSRAPRESLLHTRRTVRTADPAREAFEIEVDDRRRVERQPLRDEQAADDRDAERPPKLRAGALSKRDRHRAEQRRKRRHHDRPEAQQASLVDRLPRALAFYALGLQGEVDHHDRVLLDDADQ